MDFKKIKRVVVVVLALFWTFIGAYGYILFGGRDMFEYLSLLIITLLVADRIKSDWRFVWIGAMVWNIIDGLGVLVLQKPDEISKVLITLIALMAALFINFIFYKSNNYTRDR